MCQTVLNYGSLLLHPFPCFWVDELGSCERKMGLDETDTEMYESPDEMDTKEGADGDDDPESGKTSPATPQERLSDNSVASGDKPPGSRESFFSSEVLGIAGGMPDNPIRRRTRVAGVVQGGENGTGAAVPPAGVHHVGAIAQASRIIPELELEHGSMVFPLDSLRGDAGFEDDDGDRSG